jgi:hypothetical protein
MDVKEAHEANVVTEAQSKDVQEIREKEVQDSTDSGRLYW